MWMSTLAQNCPTPELRKTREILLRLMNAAIESVEPSRVMRKWMREEEFEIEGYEKVMVVGGGKAGASMAMTLEQSLGDRLTQGIVNIPRGTMPEIPPSKIELVEASHPIPDECGMEGARRMLELVNGNGERRGHWRPKSGTRPECRAGHCRAKKYNNHILQHGRNRRSNGRRRGSGRWFHHPEDGADWPRSHPLFGEQ
jgi:hypothetical protein